MMLRSLGRKLECLQRLTPKIRVRKQIRSYQRVGRHTTEAEREGVKSETIITCSLQQVNQQQKHVKSATRTNKIKMRETHLRHTTDASHSQKEKIFGNQLPIFHSFHSACSVSADTSVGSDSVPYPKKFLKLPTADLKNQHSIHKITYSQIQVNSNLNKLHDYR